MPPLALLARPVWWSISRKAAMLTLRGYLVSAWHCIVKAVQLDGG